MNAARGLLDLEAPQTTTIPSEGENLSGQPGPLPGRRRRFSNEEKRQFLEQASSPNESMSSIGRRYGLSVSLLFRWRRQLDGARGEVGKRQEATRGEVHDLRDRIRELEDLLGHKTHEADQLREELSRLGHNPALAQNGQHNALGSR